MARAKSKANDNRLVRLYWSNGTSAEDCAEFGSVHLATVRKLYAQLDEELAGLSKPDQEVARIRVGIQARRTWTLKFLADAQSDVDALLAHGKSADFRIADIGSFTKELQADDRLLLEAAKQQRPAASNESSQRPPAVVHVNVGRDRGDAPQSRSSSERDDE